MRRVREEIHSDYRSIPDSNIGRLLHLVDLLCSRGCLSIRFSSNKLFVAESKSDYNGRKHNHNCADGKAYYSHVEEAKANMSLLFDMDKESIADLSETCFPSNSCDGRALLDDEASIWTEEPSK